MCGAAVVPDISDDCLINVFSNLALYEKLKVELVCRQWSRSVDVSLKMQNVVSTRTSDEPRWTPCCSLASAEDNKLPEDYCFEDVVKFVKRCTRLTGLNLHSVVVSNRGLRKLQNTPAWKETITHLEICYCDLTHVDSDLLIKALSKCKNLRHLVYFKSQVAKGTNDAIVMSVAHRLENLTLGWHTISENLSLDTLGPFAQRLEIHGLGLSHWDIARLASRSAEANANLRSIRLQNSYFHHQTYEKIASSFPNLESLQMPPPGGPLSKTIVQYVAENLGRLIKLERLSIIHRHLYEDTNVDRILIPFLREVGFQLKSLSIGLFPIGNDAIHAIGTYCPNLEELNTQYNEVYNFGTSLNPMDGSTKYSGITNNALGAVAVLSKLRTLNLSLSSITEEGLFPVLEACTSIRTLKLNCCRAVRRKILTHFAVLAQASPSEKFYFEARNSSISGLHPKIMRDLAKIPNFKYRV